MMTAILFITIGACSGHGDCNGKLYNPLGQEKVDTTWAIEGTFDCIETGRYNSFASNRFDIKRKISIGVFT